MSTFITQLVDEQPAVLVIAPHPISPEIRAAWTRQDIVLECSTPAAFLALPPPQLPAYFRVVIWIPDLLLSTEKEQWQQLLERAYHLVSRVTVVTCRTTAIDSALPIWKEWQHHTVLQQQRWEKVSAWSNADLQKSQKIQWIIGQDVVNTSWILASMLTDSLDQKKVLDPQINIYPQTVVGFWRAVFELVLDPTTNSTVLRGKKTTTTSLAQRLRLEYYRRMTTLPEVIPQPANLNESWIQWPITTLQTSVYTEETLVHWLIDQVKKTSAKSTSTPVNSQGHLPTPPPQRPMVIPPQVAPTSSPRIKPQNAPLSDFEQKEVVVADVDVKPTPTLEETQPVVPVLDAQVTQLFQEVRHSQRTERSTALKKEASRTVNKINHRKKIFIGGLFAGVLGLVVLGSYASFWVVSSKVSQQVTRLLQPNSLSAQIGIGIDSTTTADVLPANWLRDVLKTQVTLSDLVLDEAFTAQPKNTLGLVEALHRFQTKQRQLQEISTGLWSHMGGDPASNSAAMINSIGTLPQELYQELNVIEELITQANFNSDSERTTLATVLSTAKKRLTTAQLLQPLWPVLLGNESQRVYAVLWQNSLELRPTGGFVQAVAFVTFDKGELTSIQSFTSDQIDQRVPGEAQPPTELTTYLGEKQWFFRDSNWDPDFPSAARQMTKYLDKVAGRPVDGILALTLPSAEALLETVGPIQLMQSGQAVSAQNLVSSIENAAQQDDTKSQEIARQILEAVLQQTLEKGKTKQHAILDVLASQLTNRNMLISLRDENEEATFQVIGWVGGLAQAVCPTQLATAPCFIDTVTQNEANIGVNLANIRVQRQVSHQVTLTATEAAHRRRITFTNSSVSKTWPSGDYKAYLRLFVSPTASLSAVVINNQKMPFGAVKITNANSRQEWAWPMIIPAKQQISVDILYSTPLPYQASSDVEKHQLSYGLLSQYQPGITSVATTTEFSFPNAWSPLLVAPTATLTQNQLLFGALPSLVSLQAAQFEIP